MRSSRSGSAPARIRARPTRFADLTRVVAVPHAVLFVAVDRRGAIVGSVIATFDGWRGNVYRMAVDPALRRGGLGRRLAGAAEDWLRNEGAVRLSALVEGDSDDRTGVLGVRRFRALPGHAQIQQEPLTPHTIPGHVRDPRGDHRERVAGRRRGGSDGRRGRRDLHPRVDEDGDPRRSPRCPASCASSTSSRARRCRRATSSRSSTSREPSRRVIHFEERGRVGSRRSTGTSGATR